ncbi:MAG: hypothetical protein JWL73_32 [Actinomycetia bacterium]|nr:hypothetical protein [Actinomycetes bacterium]
MIQRSHDLLDGSALAGADGVLSALTAHFGNMSNSSLTYNTRRSNHSAAPFAAIGSFMRIRPNALRGIPPPCVCSVYKGRRVIHRKAAQP